MPPPGLGKRKEPPNYSNTKPHRSPKRGKTIGARTILTQTTDKALNQNGDLNVASFVKAREFEIKAMGASVVDSKTVLSTRAFQQVPKDMRRRTASHNVKRVPKRLRARAAREMKDDNTPTVTSRRRIPTPHQRLRLENAKRLRQLGAITKKRRAEAKPQKQKEKLGEADHEKIISDVSRQPKLKKDTLSKPAKPPAKFRKRQIHKSWLPTHIWHAKRAQMTEPKDPLWRFAIPLSPTEKCFRTSHRASSLRGCVAWDMSYMSTIGAEGVEASLLGLLRDLGVGEGTLTAKMEMKWTRGTRSWEGWIRERDGSKRWMALVAIVWCVSEEVMLVEGAYGQERTKNKTKRKVLLRVHPSAFLQVWDEVLRVAKIQRPQVMVEDLRFDIGSIEITGPGAMEALVGVLHPISADSSTSKGSLFKDAQPIANTALAMQKDTITGSEDDADWVDVPRPSQVFTELFPVTNPSSLPPGGLLTFDISDPRLQHPPRTIQPSSTDNEALLNLLSEWPPDQTTSPASIFDRTRRLTACRLPSQKAINRRKADADPGALPLTLPKDPKIPIMLLASRVSSSWTLCLPWSCVQPVWYSLMHYPLSTGGTSRFGGLQEKRQNAFEQRTPWFPGDFPGTRAGWAWEMKQRDLGKLVWQRRPKGKRCEWESVDLGGRKGEIGVGWGCDWERLFSGPPTGDKEMSEKEPEKSAPQGRNNVAVIESKDSETEADRAEKSLPATPLSIQHLPSSALRNISHATIPSTALTPIHLTLLTAGHPSRNARIYCLPTDDSNLRARWLALIQSQTSKKRGNEAPLKADARRQPPLSEHAPKHAKAQRLAASLIAPPPRISSEESNGVLKPNDPRYPAVPDESDLVGFVTSANFQMCEGRCEAIGNIAVARVMTRHGGKSGEKGEVSAMDERSDRHGMKGDSIKPESRLCIVRDAGQSIGRLARWKFV